MITFFLQNLDGGGAERAIVSLASSIVALGHKVTLVVGDANSDYRMEVSDQIQLVDFQTRSPIVIFKQLIIFLREVQPAVVMSALDFPNIILVAAARLAGFKGKLVVSQRAVVEASLGDAGAVRRLITILLLRVCMPRANVAISNSHAAAKELVTRLKVPAEKVFTIQNAIDGERVRHLAIEAPKEADVPLHQNPMIVSVGSLTPRKDMATLVKAFAIVRAKRLAKLAILGKGPEQAHLQRLIKEHGITNDVILPGFDRNPYRWLARASVFVSASHGEGFPNAIAEALALGCQIVATDCPGDTADLLGYGKWGRLTAIGDVHGMAETINAAIDNPLTTDGKIRAMDFAPAAITKAYLNVLLADPSNHTETTRVQV